MQDEVKKTIAEISEYIDSVFKNKDVLMRNVRAMKFNADLEWFNCAIIAKKQNKSNMVVVNTIYNWEYILENEDGLELYDGKKPVRLLKPVYSSSNNTLSFEFIDTYYLDDFKNIKNVKYKKLSAVDTVIADHKNFLELQHILKNGWQDIFIESYLKQFDFYYLASEELKTFYHELLTFIFGEELVLDSPKSVGALNEKSIPNKIAIYKHMHELISCFHIAYKSYLDELDTLYREIPDLSLDNVKIKSASLEMIKNMTHHVPNKEEKAL